jgi:pilus assembly protein CpaB
VVYVRLNGSNRSNLTIVVTSKPVLAGDVIAAAHLAEVAWRADTLPPGSFQTRDAVTGRVASTLIPANRPVFDADLVSKGAVAGLEAVIAVGSRAVSLDASTVSGIGSYIRSGSLVDVIVAGRDQTDQPFSKIVVQRVRVLSVEAEPGSAGAAAKPQSITLQLDPAQAERIDLSRSIGKLSVVLRNQFDARAVQSRGARMSDLLAGTPVAPQQALQVNQAQPAAAPPVARANMVTSSTRGVEEIRGTGNPSETQ